MGGGRQPGVVGRGGLGGRARRAAREQPHVDLLVQPHRLMDLLVDDLADGLDVDGVAAAAAAEVAEAAAVDGRRLEAVRPEVGVLQRVVQVVLALATGSGREIDIISYRSCSFTTKFSEHHIITVQ